LSEENEKREPESELQRTDSSVPSDTTNDKPIISTQEAEPANNGEEAKPIEEAKPAPTEAPAAQAAAPEAPAKPAPDVAASEAAAPAAAPARAAGESEAPVRRKETDEEKAARRKATIEAREAAKAAAAQAAAQAAQAAQQGSAAGAAAKPAASEAGAAGGADEAPPKPPSPSQPRLERVVALLRELVAEDAVEEAYINEANDHLPTLVVKNERWKPAARLFRDHAELKCRYLRNVSGVDYETYLEVVYYPLNMDSRESYCVKVRADRENPSVESATPVWETANWNEREIYDLLGVDFPGHPDLRRIMMPDDWVGHPLRKDYVPLDPEV